MSLLGDVSGIILTGLLVTSKVEAVSVETGDGTMVFNP